MTHQHDLFQTVRRNVGQQLGHDSVDVESRNIPAAFAAATWSIERDRPTRVSAALLLQGPDCLLPNPSALSAAMQEDIINRKRHEIPGPCGWSLVRSACSDCAAVPDLSVTCAFRRMLPGDTPK